MVWFRNDLRTDDHPGLYTAAVACLRGGVGPGSPPRPLLPLYVLDPARLSYLAYESGGPEGARKLWEAGLVCWQASLEGGVTGGGADAASRGSTARTSATPAADACSLLTRLPMAVVRAALAAALARLRAELRALGSDLVVRLAGWEEGLAAAVRAARGGAVVTEDEVEFRCVAWRGMSAVCMAYTCARAGEWACGAARSVLCGVLHGHKSGTRCVAGLPPSTATCCHGAGSGSPRRPP